MIDYLDKKQVAKDYVKLIKIHFKKINNPSLNIYRTGEVEIMENKMIYSIIHVDLYYFNEFRKVIENSDWLTGKYKYV